MSQTRQKCFETNSSSSHSISIWNGSYHELLNMLVEAKHQFSVTAFYKDSQGREHTDVVVLTGGEYGWEIESYSSTHEKANYLAQDLAHTEDDDYRRKMLRDVILSHTPTAKDVVFDPQGYIDHQSVGTGTDAFASIEELTRFLFHPSSYVQTDNDNH